MSTQPEPTADKTYKTHLTTYLHKLTPTPTPTTIESVIRELMQSPQIESWKVLAVVVAKAEEADSRHKRIVEEAIERGLDGLGSFMVFVYGFYVKVSRKLYYYGSLKWRRLYNQLCLQKALIGIFQTWLQSSPQSTIAQQSLQLLSQTFPTFFKQQYINLTQIEINAIITWVCYLHTPNSQSYENACKLVKLVREHRTLLEQDYVSKELLVMRKLVEVCGVGLGGGFGGNLFLFVYPSQLREKDFSYFCHVYSQYLLEISQQHLYNFFTCITKSSITLQILHLISKITLLLKNSQQFYKLKHLYQTFILPVLVRRLKTCKKLQKQIYQTCEFFILGFLKHCQLGVSAFECIVRNLTKVQDNGVHDRWVRVLEILCYHGGVGVKGEVQRILSKEYGKSIELLKDPEHVERIKTEYDKIVNNQQIVWQITIRNSRKLKQYKKHPSTLKGIKNEQNECYIITVVQALHKGQLLPNILNQYSIYFKDKKCQLLNELCILFEQVSGRRSAKEIVVRYLKRKGPGEFRGSLGQEDAYHYLVQLFDVLESELRLVPNMLEEFKRIYEVKCISVNICKKCKTKKQIQQKSYTLSIPHTDILRQQTSQTIPDFNCQTCTQLTESTLTRTLHPQSQILIIQINRFSHHKGIPKKQLSTQIILRQFMGYTLVGMICHRGKNIEHGHYVYYHRVGAVRWVLLNDGAVEEFQLGGEGEEFEREWKSEMTPFILFYQRLDQ